jgi:hypothetical protein
MGQILVRTFGTTKKVVGTFSRHLFKGGSPQKSGWHLFKGSGAARLKKVVGIFSKGAQRRPPQKSGWHLFREGRLKKVVGTFSRERRRQPQKSGWHLFSTFSGNAAARLKKVVGTFSAPFQRYNSSPGSG